MARTTGDRAQKIRSTTSPIRTKSNPEHGIPSHLEAVPNLKNIDVKIIDQGTELAGTLTLPSPCRGIVIFAHGSGSSRLSPRNTRVARQLNQGQLGTLLFDLLSWDEAQDRENIFDIPFLARRLLAATQWIRSQSELKDLSLGYFGASTGGGAALWAAAEIGNPIQAIVSRGGRPDLAMPRLGEILAPTLLIVGEYDGTVLALNQKALAQLKKGCLITIPGATHLFEEAGALDSVSDQAKQWFIAHFPPNAQIR